MTEKTNLPSKVDPRTWIPSTKDLAKIEKWAGMGITQESISINLGITPATFSSKKKTFPEIEEAIKRGKAVTEDLTVSKLWSMIENENHPKHVTALLFYLKCQGGWSETKHVTVSVAPENPLEDLSEEELIELQTKLLTKEK